MLGHTPVMLNQMMQYLAPRDGGNYLDCTFGAGGYSKAILSSCNCYLTSVDQDPTVRKYAEELSNKYGDKFEFIEMNFAEINNTKQFDGIVMDLGVSSMQLDSGDRGFSFTHNGPLDMRMSNKSMSAADFINKAKEEEIANVIYQFGEERASRKIAKRIVVERAIEPILTTLRLANIVRDCIKKSYSKIDPATKTFQAIRIYVNSELIRLRAFLDNVVNILSPNGKLVIVTFHSLEDGIVKHFFKEHEIKISAKSKYAKKTEEVQCDKWLKILTKKPICPEDAEVKANYRSRSAKLRAIVKDDIIYRELVC
jgi:16S rRNA (cytosine1402-N4)-methyltransferase